MYNFSDEVRKTFENLNVPLIIIEPGEEGNFVPVIISKGFLDYNGLSRGELTEYYGEKINVGLYEKVHPDERAKLKAISIDFLSKRSVYDITFRLIQEDGYHLIHAVGYWQTMEDGTELAF